MITLGSLRMRFFAADKLRVRRVLGIRLPIGGDRTKVEMAQMPPTLQHDPPMEWLAFCGHNDAIVLAPRSGIMFAPVQFEALKSQRIEGGQEVLRPLVAVAAFPEAVINEEIIENRRAKHAVFPPKLGCSGERAL